MPPELVAVGGNTRKGTTVFLMGVARERESTPKNTQREVWR